MASREFGVLFCQVQRDNDRNSARCDGLGEARRDREDELDLAYVRSEADTATHRAEDRIAGAQAQVSWCVPPCERLENTIAPQGSIGGAVVLLLPRGRPLERRAPSRRVRGRDRGVLRRRLGSEPFVPADITGAADP